MSRIHWTRDLGNPTTPGMYTVSGLGKVRVQQDEIDKANEFDGNVYVEVVDTTTFGTDKEFILGHFIPA